MQGWADRSDSLARSGQDWPDRLPIRPATLPIALNIVCFCLALVLHRSAVTDTQSLCREAKEAGQWEQLQRYSLAAATFKRQSWSHAGNLNTVGWLGSTRAHYCYTSVHHPLCGPPEFSWWETEEGWRPTCWAICVSFRFSCDQSVINGECCCSGPVTHTPREEANQSYTYCWCDPMWDKRLDAVAVLGLERAVKRLRMEMWRKVWEER